MLEQLQREIAVCETILVNDDFEPLILTPTPYKGIKLVLEWCFGLLLLIALSPLILIAAIFVKLTSSGPALYSQIRLGRSGRPFQIYKLRTMHNNCEALTGPQWTPPGVVDSRVTPIGLFLRKTHLDELPQLWNVVRGEMSLVGPRPERPEFIVQLEKAIPHYRSRMLVRPGLTGLAQVQLPPDTDLTSVQRKLACDIYYIRNLSPSLDLRILLSTITYLAGIPFWIPQLFFHVPSGSTVERVYQEVIETTRKSTQPAGA